MRPLTILGRLLAATYKVAVLAFHGFGRARLRPSRRIVLRAALFISSTYHQAISRSSPVCKMAVLAIHGSGGEAGCCKFNVAWSEQRVLAPDLLQPFA